MNKQRLSEILKKFKNIRVLVIGDVGLDRYTIGKVERISPEAPVPIVWVQEEFYKLGLAANVVDNISTLGGSPEVVGVLGKDAAAKHLVGLLKKAKVSQKSLSQNLIVDSTRRTILKERIVSEKQQLLRVDYESLHPISKSAEKKMLSQISKLLKKSDVVIVQDYAKGTLSPYVTSEIVKMSKKRGISVFGDPNRRSKVEMYRGMDIVTPNLDEAQALSQMRIFDESSLIKAGTFLLKKIQSPHVIITRGKEGMALFTKGSKKFVSVPTFAREVFDVSGAGDTVISTLALAHAAGATMEEAMILGNLAAGIVVGKRGTATVTPQEILEFMESL